MRGFLLIQMVVAFSLLFIMSTAMFTTLANSDKGYALAMQNRIALRLCSENLELLQAGSYKNDLGSQKLSPVSLVVGKSSVSFNPSIVITAYNDMLLVRSQVSWQEGKRKHVLELKSLAAP